MFSALGVRCPLIPASHPAFILVGEGRHLSLEECWQQKGGNKMWTRLGSTGALAFVALSTTVGADASTETMKRWGLIGTWSQGCAQPAGMHNSYTIYRLAGSGSVERVRDFGAQKFTDTVTKANVGVQGELTLAIQVTNAMGIHNREEVLVKGPDARIRTQQNRVAGSEDYSVRHGRYANGTETAWLSKCQ